MDTENASQEDPVTEMEKLLSQKGFSLTKSKLEVDTRPLTTSEESRKTRRKKKYEKEVSRYFIFSQVFQIQSKKKCTDRGTQQSILELQIRH